MNADGLTNRPPYQRWRGKYTLLQIGWILVKTLAMEKQCLRKIHIPLKPGLTNNSTPLWLQYDYIVGTRARHQAGGERERTEPWILAVGIRSQPPLR